MSEYRAKNFMVFEDAVLDTNQITALEGKTVYLEDGRHFDLSQKAADKLLEWFTPQKANPCANIGNRNIDLFETVEEAKEAFKQFCDKMGCCDDCKFAGDYCELEWAFEQADGATGNTGTTGTI